MHQRHKFVKVLSELITRTYLDIPLQTSTVLIIFRAYVRMFVTSKLVLLCGENKKENTGKKSLSTSKIFAAGPSLVFVPSDLITRTSEQLDCNLTTVTLMSIDD
jgi:hypothetical protein